MPGRTGSIYDINGSDFPGPGTYYVVARTTPSCGLPLDSTTEVAVTVTLLLPADDVAFFTVTSRNQENVLEWVNSASHANVRIRYNAGPTCTFPNDPNTSGTLLVDHVGTAGMRERFPHDTPLLTNGWDYCYTIFSEIGPGTYSGGRSNHGRPMDTTLPVKWAFSTGVFSLTAPTVGWSGIIATSNDHVVHAMVRGTGVGSGEWPPAWLPIPLNGPVQSRSPIVPITVNTSNPVVYLGSQDGNVYVVDADLGGALPGYPRPPAPLGGSPGQAAPAGIFIAFGGGYDYILVGTRDTGADNLFFTFTPDLVQVGLPFDNGGGLNGIGMINGMASVDYLNARVYFTSHTRGSPDTLWCLNLQTGPPPTTLRWSRPLGNIDSSPVLMGDRVYVVAPLPTGTLYSIDADMGAAPDRTFPIPDGQAKGFVFPDWRTGDLYFATDSYVWALHDNGTTIDNKFPLLPAPGGIDLGGGVVPTSAVVFVPGSHYVYVGGSDGKLYEIDLLAGPVPTIKSVTLGDGLATVGAPSLDWQNSLIHVGTEAGIFYAVAIPFP
jgi:outer membrane protein assembly factor BamB